MIKNSAFTYDGWPRPASRPPARTFSRLKDCRDDVLTKATRYSEGDRIATRHSGSVLAGIHVEGSATLNACTKPKDGWPRPASRPPVRTFSRLRAYRDDVLKNEDFSCLGSPFRCSGSFLRHSGSTTRHSGSVLAGIHVERNADLWIGSYSKMDSRLRGNDLHMCGNDKLT